MTIQDNGSRIQYTVSVYPTNVFTFPFKIFENSDLLVYQYSLGSDPDPVSSLLPSSAYSVSILSPPLEGGNITLNTSASIDDIVIIQRSVPLSRDTDYSESGAFTGASFNTAFEKLVAGEQQIQDLITQQGLTYATTEDLSTPPNSDFNSIPKLGPNQIWKMNDSGTAIEAADDNEPSGYSTLRADLLSSAIGNDGAGRVGYYNTVVPSADTVRDALSDLYTFTYDLFTTGDVKLTLKNIADPTWVLMNDGTIGNSSSGGTTRANADTSDLFSLLWNNISDSWCPVSGGRGSSAANDFAANKTIALPKVLGRALASYGQSSLTSTFTTNFSVSPTILTFSATGFMTNGSRVRFTTTGTLPTGLSLATDYYVTILSSTTISVSTSQSNYVNSVYVTLSSNGTGIHTLSVQTTARSLGQFIGEESHLLSVSELPTHRHPPDSSVNDIVGGPPATNTVSPGAGIDLNFSVEFTGYVGGSQAHNIMQPTTFLNVMIKL